MPVRREGVQATLANVSKKRRCPWACISGGLPIRVEGDGRSPDQLSGLAVRGLQRSCADPGHVLG